MKSKPLIIILLLFPFLLSAQEVIKMRASEVAIKNNKEWGDWLPSDNLFVFGDGQLLHYGNIMPFKYTYLTQVEEKHRDKDKTLVVNALDEDGENVLIRIRNQKEHNYYQIYIDYDDVSFVFNVEPTHSIEIEDPQKLRATQVSLQREGDWSEWQSTEFDIHLSENQMKIFDEEYQDVFDFIYDIDKENTPEETILTYYAVDQEGKRCNLRIKKTIAKKIHKIYIDYEDISYAFNIANQ
ncbi:MAG: hypothetical protein ACEPOW_04240 [Bacteroidales bacterium]